jgi:O-antigen biosynthesis protein
MHKFSRFLFRNKKTSHQEEVALIKESNLFDENWYLDNNPQLRKMNIDPVSHYLKIGAIEGQDPSPTFSNTAYIKANPDVGVAKINPLLHYVKHGVVEGRPVAEATLAQQNIQNQLSITYHSSSAFSSDLRLLRSSLKARLEHLRHYIKHLHIPEANIIELSGLFDKQYYIENNIDLKDSKEDPIDHFVRIGWRKGYKPNPDFDPEFYRNHYEDISRLDLNPLVHYVEHGIVEGRETLRTSELRTTSNTLGVIGTSYQSWIDNFDTVSQEDIRSMKARIHRFDYKPKISIVMPVYNTDTSLLEKAIKSVLRQSYTYWELCIADDASTVEGVKGVLDEYSNQDKRIKVVYRSVNGHISASSNSALSVATGEFVAFMDHDDLIPPNAIFEFVAALNECPSLDIIYSDEDRIDAEGRRFGPYFKSAFNKELMLGQNYMNHFSMYRRSLLQDIGGFRIGYEGSQDYDLALRAIDKTIPQKIKHIPSILYHWRIGGEQNTYSETFMEQCVRSARLAIKDHLVRNCESGDVIENSYVKSWHRVKRSVDEKKNPISVIVPTKDQAKVLEACCRGVLERTDYKNIELIIIDHESKSRDAVKLFDKLKADPRVRVIPYKGEFNYSAMNNMAVKSANGDLICLLNNDVDVINSDWLHEMAGHAVLSDVGIVGAKLLYSDGRTQHGGVILGVAGVAGHRFHLLDRHDIGPSGLAVLSSDISAVTAACILMRKEIFEQVGGFDEAHLKVAFNDVDLCMKVMSAGYRNIYNPYATLYHYESLSRGDDLSGPKKERFEKEVAFMLEKWGDFLEKDRFYNPNVNLPSADYSLSWPPRVTKPWAKPVK